MGQFSLFPPKFRPNQKSSNEYNLEVSDEFLVKTGFNIQVTISTASMSKQAACEEKHKSVTVMAHLDTGASKTNIDCGLANYLGLTAVSVSNQQTAGGMIRAAEYAIDLSFPGSSLSPFPNLLVASCQLPFKIDESGQIDAESKFGVLIGRDIMSRWNIVWNGPTSTVFVSD